MFSHVIQLHHRDRPRKVPTFRQFATHGEQLMPRPNPDVRHSTELNQVLKEKAYAS